MYATLLSHDPNNPHAEEQGEDRQRQPGAMLGQLCSSLHRLKDVDNQGESIISLRRYLDHLALTRPCNRRRLFHFWRSIGQETRLAQATVRALRC
jgi:hypothetical protein